MTEKEQQFLAAILSDASDAVVHEQETGKWLGVDLGLRLIYSDYLQEQGQEKRGEFIMVQCCLAELSRELMSDEDCGSEDCGGCKEKKKLRERERELFIRGMAGSDSWVYKSLNNFPGNFVPAIGTTRGRGAPHAFFSSGFVEKVTCSFEEWREHGNTILQQQPVLEVTLTTHPALKEAFCDGYPYPWPTAMVLERKALPRENGKAYRDTDEMAGACLKFQWPSVRKWHLLRGLSNPDYWYQTVDRSGRSIYPSADDVS